jgi:hypothetical protein
MKNALFLTFFLLTFSIFAQTHRIGLNWGANTMVRWGGSPLLGPDSPFDSRISFNGNLSYTFIFDNNFTINVKNALVLQNVIQKDAFIVFDRNLNEILTDYKFQHRHYHLSLGGGYLFQVSDHYAIDVDAGVSMLYFYKKLAVVVETPQSRWIDRNSWNEASRSFGVYFGLNHHYRIHQGRHHAFYLSGSLRATQIFNYLEISKATILPELTIGLSIAFNNNKRKRFSR